MAWIPGDEVRRNTSTPKAATPASTSASAAATASAGAALQALFASYGLASLAPKILEYAKQGLGRDESMLKLQETTEWKTRFAGNELRAKKGWSVLPPDQYLAKEDDIAAALAYYQLPKGFYDDPSDYAKAIAADIGGAEMRQRLAARKAIVTDGAHTGVLDYARQQYGLSQGDLIAYFIDPERAAPFLEKVAAASQVGAAAARTGYGAVGRSEAERLAALGINADQAAAGYSTAAGLSELTSSLGGQDSNALAKSDLTGAIFDQDAAAKARVERKQAERKATFAGGGGFATGQGGVSGLGSANT